MKCQFEILPILSYRFVLSNNNDLFYPIYIKTNDYTVKVIFIYF